MSTNNTKAFETYESEVRSYCRNFPTVFVKAKGSIQTDENGKEYIDFFCGSGALNYGHNNPYIKEKVVEYLQNDGVMHALDMYTKPKREFIEYFENEVIRPRGFDYKIQFVGPTGTNAVEAALKLARKVKKRNNVFALMGAFHGMTLGSLALTTNADSRKGAGVPLYNVTHIPAPYMFPELDTVAYMERLITDDHSGVEKPAAIRVYMSRSILSSLPMASVEQKVMATAQVTITSTPGPSPMMVGMETCRPSSTTPQRSTRLAASAMPGSRAAWIGTTLRSTMPARIATSMGLRLGTTEPNASTARPTAAHNPSPGQKSRETRDRLPGPGASASSAASGGSMSSTSLDWLSTSHMSTGVGHPAR